MMKLGWVSLRCGALAVLATLALGPGLEAQPMTVEPSPSDSLYESLVSERGGTVYNLTAHGAPSDMAASYYGVAVAPEGWMVMLRQAPTGAKQVTAKLGTGRSFGLSRFSGMSADDLLVLAKFRTGIDPPAHADCVAFNEIKVGDSVFLLPGPGGYGVVAGTISGKLAGPPRVIMKLAAPAADLELSRGTPVFLPNRKLVGLAVHLFRGDPKFIEVMPVKELLDGVLAREARRSITEKEEEEELAVESVPPAPSSEDRTASAAPAVAQSKPSRASAPVISSPSGKDFRQKYLGTWYATGMYLDLQFDHTLKLKMGSAKTVVGTWDEISDTKARLHAPGIYPYGTIEEHPDKSVTVNLPDGDNPVTYKVR